MQAWLLFKGGPGKYSPTRPRGWVGGSKRMFLCKKSYVCAPGAGSREGWRGGLAEERPGLPRAGGGPPWPLPQRRQGGGQLVWHRGLGGEKTCSKKGAKHQE